MKGQYSVGVISRVVMTLISASHVNTGPRIAIRIALTEHWLHFAIRQVRRYVVKRKISRAVGPAVIGLLIAFSIVLAACSSFGLGGNASGGASSGGAPSGNVSVSGQGSVRVANVPQLGQILATPDGKTLYTNTVDTPGNLRCVDISCTGLWKPFTTDSQPTAGNDIPGKLELITRPDGSKQVAYNQQPLYTFYLDTQPGDAKGNGFTDFGGTWHVVTLTGAPAGNSNNGGATPGGYSYP